MSEHDPRDLVARASDAAIEAANDALREAGAELVLMTVTLVADDPPEGEANANTAGWGFDDDHELLAFLISTTQQVAGELGFELHVVHSTGGQG
jgi:hypothetical protein